MPSHRERHGVCVASDIETPDVSHDVLKSIRSRAPVRCAQLERAVALHRDPQAFAETHKSSATVPSASSSFFMRDRSSIRYKLVPLERASLVALIPNARDARARRIVLMEVGKSKLAEATVLWHGAQQKFEDAVGPEQAIAMRKAADVIAAVSFDLATDG